MEKNRSINNKMADAQVCRATLKNGNPCTKHRLSDTEYCGVHTRKDNRNRCIGRTTDGEQCKKQALEDSIKCKTHQEVPLEQQCTGHLFNGRRCTKQKKQGSELCATHDIPENRKCRGRRYMRGPEGFFVRMQCGRKNKEPNGFCRQCGVRERYEQIREQYQQRGRQIREEWGDYIVMRLVELGVPILQARSNVGHRIIHAMLTENLEVEQALVSQAEFIQRIATANNAVPARSDLERITRDSQNVHTVATVNQTNRNIELLMKTPVPETQNTIEEIKVTWSQLFKKEVSPRLYEDMQRWYDHAYCYKADDYKYRHVLNHLWARIRSEKQADIRRQLYIRLNQECSEAVGLCMDGHISRLAQVMVGFDPEYQIEVNANEELQRRIPLIRKITNMDERLRTAMNLMNELNVTPEDAQPWLDALIEDE